MNLLTIRYCIEEEREKREKEARTFSLFATVKAPIGMLDCGSPCSSDTIDKPGHHAGKEHGLLLLL